MPEIVTQCCDCGLGTNVAGEWFVAKDKVWDEAWPADRLKSWHYLPGQMVLCIGCLEKRIGRTLCATDFTDEMVNRIDKVGISDRMRSRLAADVSLPIRKRGRPKGSKNRGKPRCRRLTKGTGSDFEAEG